MDSADKLKLFERVKRKLYSKGYIYDTRIAEEIARRWIKQV